MPLCDYEGMIGGLNNAACYRAILLRDRRYDGIFYFAVKASGSYCRPTCSLAHEPHKKYLIFRTTQEAAMHNYQPCRNCRPGRLKNNLSAIILESIDAGAIAEMGVHGLASELHISERHLRRLIQRRLGVSPSHFNNAKRLDAAKIFIIDTRLPIIDIAFRAGFASLRQFNNSFKAAYKISPRGMRKANTLIPLSQTLNTTGGV